MLTESPLTANERWHLSSYANGRKINERLWDAFFIVFFISALIYLPFWILWLQLDIVENASIYNPWFILISVSIGLYFSRAALRQIFEKRAADNPFAADLEGGLAHVQTLNIKRVCEIEEYDDEGAGFLLELTDGGVLSLISQNYYEYVTDIDLEEGEPDLRGQFPQTRIEYRYGPNSGLALNAIGVGESLRPAIKIPRCTKFKKGGRNGGYNYAAPEDGAFYRGTIEDVCRQFGYQPVPI